jgi:hypothetical protein
LCADPAPIANPESQQDRERIKCMVSRLAADKSPAAG